MVNTSNRPISVDGVRLDTLAWNITKITRATAGRRSGDYEVPNLDGAIPSLHDPLEPASFGLELWLRGTDADGAVPSAGQLDTMRANLDELLHLFGKRHRFLDLREQVSATEERRAWAKLDDSISPELNAPGSAGVMNVSFTLPFGVWESPLERDWTAAPASGAVSEVTTLDGSTERITDAVFLVRGPVTTPRITDPSSGMYVQLDAALADGQAWLLDSRTWTSRYGSTTLPALGASYGLDTYGLGIYGGAPGQPNGTDASGLVTIGGPGRAYPLPLTPVRRFGRRVPLVTISSASGNAPSVTIRSRRKYAA